MIDQHSSLSEKFLKKWFWLYLFGYIIAPLWYVVKILISNEVSISDIWVLYGIISLITLLSAFSDVWVWESLKYFIPKFFQSKQYWKIKSILFYSIIIQFISAVVLWSVFFFGSDILSTYYFKDESAKNIIQVFSLYFIWINIFNLIWHFLLAVQNTFSYKICEFIRITFLLTTVTGIILLNQSNILAFSYAWIIWLYIGILSSMTIFYKKYYVLYLKNQKIIFSKELLKEFFSYSFNVFLAAQAAIILSQIDMQMIILMLWTLEAWYYSIYLSLITIPFLLTGPLFLILLPIFSELFSKQNIKSIKNTKNNLSEIFVIFWILFWTLLYLLGENIAYVLFGESYLLSWIIIKYSCLFLVFNLLFQINLNILWWIWKVRVKLYITLIAIFFNTILNLILINYIWVWWAALATWMWWILIWVMSEYALWKIYFYWFNIYFLMKNITISFIFWFIYSVYASDIFVNASRWFSLFLILIIWLLFTVIIFTINYSKWIYFLKKLKGLK